ncbi:MAG: FAD-binding oxidoreductase [Acidobacteriota bacterium]|nr:FAD-binding oxidoreductase [Acidobacteriota bacterium]
MDGVRPSPDRQVVELNERLGDAAARPGTPADRIDGVVPAVVVAPPTSEAVARALRWASDTDRSVLIRGGGTKLGWGALAREVDLLLSTEALAEVEAHRHGDLTATVQAGATLAATNAELARHRQWLPLDPPAHEHATIGGIVATNDSGPRRQRHGAPRDLIIGMTLARADGVLAKSGGIVVKNVAGYDLSRLFTGSFGCLGVILTATFKLAPVADASRSVRVSYADATQCATYANRLLDLASTPTAMEVTWPSSTLLVRFESVESVAVQQAAHAVALAGETGGTATVIAEADEPAAWRAHQARVFEGEGAVVKLVVLPSDLPATFAWLDEVTRGGTLDAELIGRAGLGVLYLRIAGPLTQQISFIRQLRERLTVGHGSAVLQRGDEDLRRQLDPWGTIGDGLPVMRQVKRQFDPAGTLNPGRGPGGI